jgi:hypothetical protein
LRFSALCALALFCGCSQSPAKDEVAHVYRTGMTRADAANVMGKLTWVETRPAGGWDETQETVERIGLFASRFEKSRGTIVQTCEVYWVPRGFMGLGVWWDYLFFGPDDRLLGFQRRFVD